MASKTSASGGSIVFAVISGVLALLFFIMAVWFYAQSQQWHTEYDKLDSRDSAFIHEGERNRDDVRGLLDQARRSNKSLVGYLLDQRQQMAAAVTGSKSDGVEEIREKFAQLDVGQGTNVLAGVRTLTDRIAQLQRDVQQADVARQRAIEDQQRAVARVNDMEQSQQSTINSLTAQVNEYKDLADQYRTELNDARSYLDQSRDQIVASARDQQAQLQEEIDRLQRELLLATNTISNLQQELRGNAFTAQDEFALVDARIITVDNSTGNVIIDRGRDDKVPLSLTFEVYNDASALRPDPDTGEYPTGKAALEVIRVDEKTATARVTRSLRGNPIVRGDVVANAVYDPNKTYTFMVYGNFDFNGDGRYTPSEQSDIRAMIAGWGGEVVDEMSGDLDYLVLGQRPALPPQPPITAPPAVISEFIRVQNVVNKYDELLEQAQATSVPVLNENRLRTLTGQRR